ncbi:mitochondrial import inner membrane translocase subunit Tim10 B [Scomber scombrus]|uniref:Mitochondrial import inner membrane translocase subunit Tim10 B n=2 Tax=Scomber scombrus TaxID=13677 RepID=A0AAV1N607_SCOSC
MDADQQLRNLRDFLLVYNRMTEACFQRCSSNFNYRNLTMDEERCVDSCAGKLIRSNHRLMGTYVQLMPRMVQRRMEEMESKAAELAKSGAALPVTTETSPTPETPITTPPLMLPSGTDDGPDVHGSVLKPAGLDIPLELDAAVPKSTVAAEVKSSAATPLTPAIETLDLLTLGKVGSGPSHTAGPPQLPIAGAQIESGSSVPVFMPAKPASLTDEVPVLTLAAPTVSKSTVSLAGQEKAPEVPPQSGQ